MNPVLIWNLAAHNATNNKLCNNTAIRQTVVILEDV